MNRLKKAQERLGQKDFVPFALALGKLIQQPRSEGCVHKEQEPADIDRQNAAQNVGDALRHGHVAVTAFDDLLHNQPTAHESDTTYQLDKGERGVNGGCELRRYPAGKSAKPAPTDDRPAGFIMVSKHRLQHHVQIVADGHQQSAETNMGKDAVNGIGFRVETEFGCLHQSANHHEQAAQKSGQRDNRLNGVLDVVDKAGHHAIQTRPATASAASATPQRATSQTSAIKAHGNGGDDAGKRQKTHSAEPQHQCTVKRVVARIFRMKSRVMDALNAGNRTCRISDPLENFSKRLGVGKSGAKDIAEGRGVS